MHVPTVIGLSAVLTGIASAAGPGCKQAPVGPTPSGNPTIHPEVNEAVPAGEPFQITWTNTTAGRVSINLLRGPSTNVVPIACIVENLPNKGHFKWHVPATLEPDVTHYGLQIIVDGTGQYQYTPQFGIAAPSGGKKSPQPHSPTPSSTPRRKPTSIPRPSPATP